MSVKFKSTGLIKAKLGLEPNGKVQRFFTNSCYKHMDKYVPMDEDNLRENVTLLPNAVIYESPYARYQYYGKLMVMSNGKGAFYSPDYGFWSKKGEKKILTDIDLNYHTPGTGPFWDREMVSAEIDDVVKEVQELFRR